MKQGGKASPVVQRQRVTLGGYIPLDALPGISAAEVEFFPTRICSLRADGNGRIEANKYGHTHESMYPVASTSRRQHVIKPGKQMQVHSTMLAEIRTEVATREKTLMQAPGLVANFDGATLNMVAASKHISPARLHAYDPAANGQIAATLVTLGGKPSDRSAFGMQLPWLPALPPDVTATTQAKRVTARGGPPQRKSIFVV